MYPDDLSAARRKRLLCLWRRTGRSEVGRKGGQNGLSCAIISAYSTREKAGIAQLVEQLICNQQVVGSNPTAGSLVNRGLIPSARRAAWTLLRHFFGSRASKISGPPRFFRWPMSDRGAPKTEKPPRHSRAPAASRQYLTLSHPEGIECRLVDRRRRGEPSGRLGKR